MGFVFSLLAVALVLGLFWAGARLVNGGEGAGRRRARVGGPSQTGNELDLFPDRTGARTKLELGAKEATNHTYQGDKEEPTARPTGTPNQAGGRQTALHPVNKETAYGVVQSDPTSPAMQPGIRREVQPGPHEHGPGTQPAADLAPEDQYGEDRPANRTMAPDQPPTQWHPRQHGVPGDHIREGHHRSATAPIKTSDATDPYAHQPVPGPNHIPPEAGQELPENVRP